MNTCIEYIWIDGKQNLRCKTKVMNKNRLNFFFFKSYNFDNNILN